MKVLIVDDHQMIREGIRPVLSRLEPGTEVEVLEAGNFEEAMWICSRHPDLELVLLDQRLPDVAGFAALSSLQERFASLPVVVMSGEDDAELVRSAIDRGALGYIPKSSSGDVILGALRLVLSGGTYVPREAIERPASPAGLPQHSPDEVSRRLGITPRQAEVLGLLLAGKSNKVISRDLNLAESTVKNHVAAVFKALNVTTRVQAVLAAAKLGIKS